jgi:diguanylate cyclase (GGDEF)-like protein
VNQGIEQTTGVAPADERRHVLLIVDDEAENLDLLASTLRRGNTIVRAKSGEEAIDYLHRDGEVHMVITDQRMPGISGVALLAEMKRARPEAIRILITGYTDGKVAVDAINEGEVHRYVQKPWDPKELQLVVRMELERFDLRARARELTQDLILKNEELRRVNQELLEQKRRFEQLAAEYKRQKEYALEMSGKLSEVNRDLLTAQDEIKNQNRKLETVNRKLERLSITDGLTGFYNHRQMHVLLDGEIGRARRYDLRLSCMMVDLDNFKEINDTHGHQAGDQVLKTVTEIVRANIRDTDMPARYGGDEFLIILPHTGLDRALFLAKRIHKDIAAFEFASDAGVPFRQTVSIGIATFPHPKAQTKEDFVRIVDEALYRAKETGRDRVVVYE